MTAVEIGDQASRHSGHTPLAICVLRAVLLERFTGEHRFAPQHRAAIVAHKADAMLFKEFCICRLNKLEAQADVHRRVANELA
eukprot:4882478-Amphidinium_carterae.1